MCQCLVSRPCHPEYLLYCYSQQGQHSDLQKLLLTGSLFSVGYKSKFKGRVCCFTALLLLQLRQSAPSHRPGNAIKGK